MDLQDFVKMPNSLYHFVISFKALNEFVQSNTFPNFLQKRINNSKNCGNSQQKRSLVFGSEGLFGGKGIATWPQGKNAHTQK